MARRIGIITFICASLALVGPIFAGDPKPFEDFTFKRIKVPKPGATKRITVQVEPKAEVETEATPEADTPVVTASAFDWYWEEISPSLTASGPGRLSKAIAQLDKGPGLSAPRLQVLQKILGEYGTHILTATIGTEVSPALVLAVITAESTGRAEVVSHAGATGLMQLMPATAERFGVTELTDPAENIKGGVAYLNWLMDRFDGDPILVLASYNAGETAVARYEGVPPFNETRAYVPKVLAAWTVARALCKTPPELISDGCAFSLNGS